MVNKNSKSPLRKRHTPSLGFRHNQLQEKLSYKEAKKYRRTSKSWTPFGPFSVYGFILLLFIAILTIGSIWFFLLSSKFLVNSVEIVSATTLTEEQIKRAFDDLKRNKKFLLVPQNHTVLLNPGTLAEALSKHNPSVIDVNKFSRAWPDKVSFAVVEAEPVFLIHTNDGFRYLLDQNGVIMGEVGAQMPRDLILLEGNFDDNLRVGQKIASNYLLNYIKDLHNNWYDSWSFRPVKYSVVMAQAGEFTVAIDEGWYIKTDADADPNAVLRALDLLTATELTDPKLRQNLAYVDLRLSTRVFYCLASERCANN